MNNIGDTNNIELSITPEIVDVLWELATAEIEAIDMDLERGELTPEERAAAMSRYGLLCQITARLWTGTAFWAIDNEENTEAAAVPLCELCGNKPGVTNSRFTSNANMDACWVCGECEADAEEDSKKGLPSYDDVYGPLVSGGAS